MPSNLFEKTAMPAPCCRTNPHRSEIQKVVLHGGVGITYYTSSWFLRPTATFLEVPIRAMKLANGHLVA